MTASCVYEGVVAHSRFKPVEHRFSYPIALLYLDLGELPDLFDRRLLWSARREERRLAAGYTYEPQTFIERTNWTAAG